MNRPEDEPTIRMAEPGDLARLAEVEAAADRLAEQTLATSERFEPPTTGEQRAAQTGFLLVVGRPVIGFAHVLEEHGTAHLEQIAVHPGRGGQGLGTALLRAACAEAAARNHDEMTLTTFDAVPFNRPWYERNGFVVVADPTGVLARHVIDEQEFERFGRRVAMITALTTIPPGSR